MKKSIVLSALLVCLVFTISSCKKSYPSYKIAGTYSGNFSGIYLGNDTIVNDGYLVIVDQLDKSTVSVAATLMPLFEVVVAKNGINVEPVAEVEGLSNFLYEGDTRTLSFTYTKDGNTATFVGTKPGE